MDDTDRADQEIERSLGEALRARKPAAPIPTGYCFWCDDPVDEDRRWCSPACRDNWQRLTDRGR
jgi:RNA polymerase-binding transcription factor DksA